MISPAARKVTVITLGLLGSELARVGADLERLAEQVQEPNYPDESLANTIGKAVEQLTMQLNLLRSTLPL